MSGYLKFILKRSVGDIMTGNNMTAVNPEALFSQQKKGPGMHCFAFSLTYIFFHFVSVHCLLCEFS